MERTKNHCSSFDGKSRPKQLLPSPSRLPNLSRKSDGETTSLCRRRGRWTLRNTIRTILGVSLLLAITAAIVSFHFLNSIHHSQNNIGAPLNLNGMHFPLKQDLTAASGHEFRLYEAKVTATGLPLSLSSQNQNKAIESSTSNHSPIHVFPDDTITPILPKVLVIYFPQFHRDPLNDRLWGQGFTDWDNLRAAPEFNRKGIKIPRPTTLGYYDLLNTTIRQQQGELAKLHGLDGFVYHHYWFYDDRYPGPSLHGPLMKMLEDGYPDIEFCLNWVPGSWTATWHRKRNNTNDTNANLGAAKRGQDTGTILQEQFFPNDPLDSRIKAHYQWLRPFFHHKNYIKMDGKPIFMVYSATLSGAHRVVARLKELAMDDGFPGLYCPVGQYSSHAALLPDKADSGQKLNQTLVNGTIFDRLTDYPFPYDYMTRMFMMVPQWCLKRSRNTKMISRMNEIVGIVTSFDNTPRRSFEEARVWVGLDGQRGIIRRFAKNLWAAIYYHACCFADGDGGNGGGTDQLILINAWNEWAEGMAMEPSDVYGDSFLKTVKQIKTEFRTGTCRKVLGKK